jgi:hypothetical protein
VRAHIHPQLGSYILVNTFVAIIFIGFGDNSGQMEVLSSIILSLANLLFCTLAHINICRKWEEITRQEQNVELVDQGELTAMILSPLSPSNRSRPLALARLLALYPDTCTPNLHACARTHR